MTAWRRFCRNRLALVGLALVVVLAVSAALAPWLAPYDPARQSLIEKRAKPAAHRDHDRQHPHQQRDT